MSAKGGGQQHRRTIQGSPGLFTAVNPEVAPPGALKRCDGAIISRAGRIERPKPFYDVGPVGGGGAIAHLFRYAADESSYPWSVTITGGVGLWNSSFSGVNTPVNFAGAYGMTSALAGGNAYLPWVGSNSNLGGTGWIKIDSTSSTQAYWAGVPRALDLTLTLVSSGTLLASGNTVGYRVVWGIIDANNNLVVGPPSGRFTVTATAAQDVTVKTWIPYAVTQVVAMQTKYFYQVYRTKVNTVGADPGDECALVYQATLTSTDVSNGYVTFTDSTQDSLAGAALYTNPSQEGIAKANYSPPLSKCLSYFKGSMFYGNTVGKQRLSVQMLGIPEQWAIQSIAANTPSAGQSTYTFLPAVDLTGIDGTMRLAVVGTAANDGTWSIVSVNNTSHTVVVSNAGAAAGAVGTAMSGLLVIAGGNYYPTYAAEVPVNQYFQVTTSGTTSSNVAATCASLLRIVNQQGAVPTAYGYYESGPDDGAGKMMFEEAGANASSFTFYANGTTTAGYRGALSSKFVPSCPSTAKITSSNDARSNRLFYSKASQPEHVPLVNYFDIGSMNDPIIRTIALRNALLVFKSDGLFGVYGENGNYSVALIDATRGMPLKHYSQGYGISLVGVIDGKAYYMSKNGLSVATENGARDISAPIQNLLKTAVVDGNALVRRAYTVVTAVADDYHRSIIFDFYLYGLDSATTGIRYYYGVDTGAWSGGSTGALRNASRSITSTSYGITYVCIGGRAFSVGANLNSSVYGTLTMQHINSGTSDIVPAGDGITAYINSGSGTSYVLVGGTAGVVPVVGDVLVQPLSYLPSTSDSYYTITNVTGSGPYTVTLNASASLTPGNATYILRNQAVSVEWIPFTSGDDATTSRFVEYGILGAQENTTLSVQAQAYTDTQATPVQTASFTAASSNGVAVTNYRSQIPPQYQRSRRLSVSVTNSEVSKVFTINGISYEWYAYDDRGIG